jgi:hypothetical protein
LFCRPLIAAQLLLVDEVIWSGCKYVEGLGWIQYVTGDYVCSSIPIAPFSMLDSCGIYSRVVFPFGAFWPRLMLTRLTKAWGGLEIEGVLSN